jgi:hypothetical protein
MHIGQVGQVGATPPISDDGLYALDLQWSIKEVQQATFIRVANYICTSRPLHNPEVFIQNFNSRH